jgi:phage terminase large subunit-like protein
LGIENGIFGEIVEQVVGGFFFTKIFIYINKKGYKEAFRAALMNTNVLQLLQICPFVMLWCDYET